MDCVSFRPVVIDGQPLTVVAAEPTCATGLVVATRDELARMSSFFPPLTPSESGAITSALLQLFVLAFCMGILFRFIANSRRE